MSGATSFLFSGAPVPPQPTGSDTTSTQPLWLQTEEYNLDNAATNLASQQYTPYPGQQVATPSGATQQAWQMAQNSVGNYQPNLDQAGALTQAASNQTNQASQMGLQAAAPIGASQINQYMSPYTQDVVGALQQSANYNLMNNQLPAISSQFVGAGQAASPQMAQADNNALYLSNQALDQATAGALQSGYQGAVGTALQEQSAAQQGASQQNQFAAQQAAYGAQQGQLGALTQQLGAAQTGLVAAAGQSQDAANQANINASMNNFYAQQQWPYQNLAFASNITNGLNVPSNTQTVGMNYNPGQTYSSSPLTSFVGTTLGSTAVQNGTGSNALTYARGGRVRGGALTLARIA